AARRGRQEMDQRDSRLRAERRLRRAHLPIAVVHAPLQRDDLARGDTVCRPARHDRARVLRLVEHRQLLHANALAFLAMAARAVEIPGADAMEVESAA